MKDRTVEIEKELKDTSEIKINIKLCAEFWFYVLKKQFPLLAVYFIFLTVMAAFTPVGIYLWKYYIDAASASNDFLSVCLVLLLYVILRVAVDFGYFFSIIFMDAINFSSWRVLDKSINEKASKLHGEYFEIPNIQNIISRAWEFNHGSYIQLYQSGLNLIFYTVQAAGIYITLYIISPVICAIAVLIIPFVIVSRIMDEKISVIENMELTDSENECNYYKNTIYEQRLIKDIIINNAFDFFQKNMKRLLQIFFSEKRKWKSEK